MREDLPARELQNLRPVPSDGEISMHWARSVNRACTAWLLERGIFGSPWEYRYPGAPAPGNSEPAKVEAAPAGKEETP